MPIIKDESIDNMSIIEFIKYIQCKYYPDMDISFMESFMAMIKHKDEYIVCSDELAKYGVLSIKSDKKSIDITHVKQLLDSNGLIENTDFRNVPLQGDVSSRGPSTRKAYMLKPYAFKTCLSNSKQQPKYRRYFLFLEECIEYYNKQQLVKKDNEIKALCDKLDRAHIHNEQLHADNERLHADNQKLLAASKAQIDKIDELIEEVRSLRKYIDEIREYLRQRAIPPEKNGTMNSVVIMKNNTNFSYIRGQDKYVKKQRETKLSNGYTKILEFNNVPNGVYLCINIIEYFKMKKIIRCTRNDFVLVSDEINDDELIEIMKEIFDERLMV